MPLILADRSHNNSVFAVWKRIEGISFFIDHMDMHAEEIAQLYGQLPSNILQWLSSRFLLRMISGTGKDGFITKDEFGKPHIKDYSKYVSLSHCGNMIAAVVCDNHVGIDIEKISSKPVRIKEKFVSDRESELKNKEEEKLFFTRLWTIKEAVYKAYGKKQLKFKEQINIRSDNECFLSLNDNSIIDYYIESHFVHDHILSIAIARS